MDAMKNLFENTLVVKSARGNASLWYNRDGSFTGKDDAGNPLSGIWTIDGTSLCTTILTPERRPEHRGTLEPHAVGDVWEDHRTDGTVSLLTIAAGR